MKITHQKAKGFTLVELLVVIAIIATLAVLATPMIMKAMTKAKIVTATNICVSVESAVDRFENEYSYLPFDPEESSSPAEDTPDATPIRSDTDFMTVLAGEEEDINFKQIKFFELAEPTGTSEENYKDGMLVKDGEAKLYDAWGNPYYILVDYDLDGKISHPFKSEENEEISGKKVLVFSSGPDGEKDVPPTSGSTPKELKQIPSNFR